jgi:hypothetical protein
MKSSIEITDGSTAGSARDTISAAGRVVESVRFETRFGSAEVFPSADRLPTELRARAFAGQAKDLRYYDISARALAGQFDHRYLVLRNASTGAVCVQPLFFVDQDILEGIPRNLHAVLTWPRRFFSRWLKMRMLVAGCSAGDGALDCSEPWAVGALREAIGMYAKKTRAAMVLLKDFPAMYRDALQPFATGEYRRVPSMPACEIDLDFATFEEFMQKRLGRKLRYKYIKLNKKPPIDWEMIVDATPVAGELYELYKQTHDRSKMRFEHLTPEFFAMIGREMPDVVRFFIWRVEGRIAAFALCLVHDGTMHHLNIGFDYSVSLDLQLYYVTMRDLFKWALEQGLTRYYTGQLNYDPKLHFKMRLAPLDLYSRHTSSLINPFFKIALGYLQPVRHEPTVRQFPNAGDL